MTGFQIRRLTLIGHGLPNAEVQFSTGLNVISGPSDTGKTFILQSIDYMLGGKSFPEGIPEIAGYESILLTLELKGNGDEVTLKRSIKGGRFTLLSPEKVDQHLIATHKPENKKTISHYLLSLTGITGKRVRTNKQGNTREVSFRDIARLILVDEENIISKISPVLTGNPVSDTPARAVFRLLLTGSDDSSLTAVEDPKVMTGKLVGKVEILNLLMSQAKERIAKIQLPGDVAAWKEELLEIENLFESTQQELKLERNNVAELEESRRNFILSFHKNESRVDVLSELQGRFILLDQQYQSDLRRLESIMEANSRLEQMSEERCSICGATAEHQEHQHQTSKISSEDIMQSCLAEIAKIEQLVSDLQFTMMANQTEITQLNEFGTYVKEEIRMATTQLNDLLRPRIETMLVNLRDSQMKRDTYRNALELSERVNEFQNLRGDIESAKTDKGVKLNSVRVSSDEAKDFCKEVESLLQSWNFPNLDGVTFCESKQDIIISGRPRASYGKGVRAIAHAAFNLALLKFSIKMEMPHPGFVLIDSPLVVYREPDIDEDGFSFDLKEAFYREIAKDFHTSQVIIFENEDPPVDLDSSVMTIRFTGGAYGRQGFIPKNN